MFVYDHDLESYYTARVVTLNQGKKQNSSLRNLLF